MLKLVRVRVAGFAVLAVPATGLARILVPDLPEDLALKTGSQTIESLPGVLTWSMLVISKNIIGSTPINFCSFT